MKTANSTPTPPASPEPPFAGANGSAIKAGQILATAAALFLSAIVPPFDDRMYMAAMFLLILWQVANWKATRKRQND